ncbi:methyltransferase family protein [Acidocella sp.]|jgi:protein-S-isoprenylcysteine O-methyltransferase Ste14|uniref:methyltransferase family protein n=1 Tax=Acidocella sp. TaxID=50710 RepID=UPI002F3F5A51
MFGQMFVVTSLWFVALAVVQFAAAGTLDWPRGWAFLLEMAIFSYGIGAWLAVYDPELLESRLFFRVRNSPAPDRKLLPAALPAFLAWLVLMGFDARRFAWSHVPAALGWLGAACIALCMGIAVATFAFNSFAAPQLRIQTQRAQHVITSGPYAVVRHPLYAGAIFYFLGTPLLLGSWWGLIMLPLGMTALAWRIGREEDMLRTAFPDYDRYAARVKFRLIPGVW